jgi:transcription termination factor Rho
MTKSSRTWGRRKRGERPRAGEPDETPPRKRAEGDVAGEAAEVGGAGNPEPRPRPRQGGDEGPWNPDAEKPRPFKRGERAGREGAAGRERAGGSERSVVRERTPMREPQGNRDRQPDFDRPPRREPPARERRPAPGRETAARHPSRAMRDRQQPGGDRWRDAGEPRPPRERGSHRTSSEPPSRRGGPTGGMRPLGHRPRERDPRESVFDPRGPEARAAGPHRGRRTWDRQPGDPMADPRRGPMHQGPPPARSARPGRRGTHPLDSPRPPDHDRRSPAGERGGRVARGDRARRPGRSHAAGATDWNSAPSGWPETGNTRPRSHHTPGAAADRRPRTRATGVGGPPRARPRHSAPDRDTDARRTPLAAREAIGESAGVLELSDRGFGFLRQARRMYHPTEEDVFVPPQLIRGLKLREGLMLAGPVGRARNGGLELLELTTINELPVDAYERLVPLEELTPTDPDERLRFATGAEPVTTRVIDLLTPVGKGQRALIVAPPRSGKTVLLQHMAHGISENHPEVKLKVLLIDERPEEVTDMKRTVRGEVVASSSDMNSDAHVRVAELVLEQSRREVEFGHDVVIFLDSLTRLGRAYNRETGSSGRTLTGGIDARALERPKRIFGAARNVEHGGSLTIIATALIDTGSRMDEVIFQEFKGTGNMEMVLDRSISDMRIWPAVDVRLSGTRKEEKLYTPEELPRIRELRRQVSSLDPLSAIQELLKHLDAWEGNEAGKVAGRRATTPVR